MCDLQRRRRNTCDSFMYRQWSTKLRTAYHRVAYQIWFYHAEETNTFPAGETRWKNTHFNTAAIKLCSILHLTKLLWNHQHVKIKYDLLTHSVRKISPGAPILIIARIMSVELQSDSQQLLSANNPSVKLENTENNAWNNIEQRK